MNALLPAVAVAALAGLQDIRGSIPPPDLPPFAFTALVTLTAAGAGALSLAQRKREERSVPPEESDPVLQRLLRLRDDFDRGELPEAPLYDELAELLRLMIAPANPALTTGELVAAARGNLPEEPLALLGELLRICDAARYGGESPAKPYMVQAIGDSVVAAGNLRR